MSSSITGLSVSGFRRSSQIAILKKARRPNFFERVRKQIHKIAVKERVPLVLPSKRMVKLVVIVMDTNNFETRKIYARTSHTASSNGMPYLSSKERDAVNLLTFATERSLEIFWYLWTK